MVRIEQEQPALGGIRAAPGAKREHGYLLGAVAVAVLVAAPARAQVAAEQGPEELTLEQAMQRLEAQNLSLAQARARAEESRAVQRQVRAAILPTVAATGSFTRNSDEASTPDFTPLFGRLGIPPPSNVPLVIQPLEQFQAGASLRVPLFAANAWSDLAAARHGARAAEHSVEGARLQLRMALEQAAWMTTAAEEVVEAAEKAVAVARDHEQSTQRALAAGTAAPLAHLQAQTDVVRRESDLVQARSERTRAQLALGVLLGQERPVRIRIPAVALPDALDAEALADLALARRPELKAQDESVRAAESQEDSAYWRLAPTLAANLSAATSDVPYPTGKTNLWRATAELSWVLYDGGFRYGKRDQAQAALTGARAAQQQQRLDVRQQVRDAVRDVGVARERLRMAEQQLRLASDAAATARRSYEAGLVGNLDVLDANNRVFQAEVGLADARARLGGAGAALARAVGGQGLQ